MIILRNIVQVITNLMKEIVIRINIETNIFFSDIIFCF